MASTFPVWNCVHQRKIGRTTMTPHSFPAFSTELQRHTSPGYHVFAGPISTALAANWFNKLSICCPPSFLEFLQTFGPGRFFGGSLVIFPVDERDTQIEKTTARLPEQDRAQFFAVGYDGTTEGCYCLDRSGQRAAVFWHSFETTRTIVLHPDFRQWIESCPAQLFNENTYAGYRSIRDVAAVHDVIKERGAFDVRLIKVDMTKVRPPGHEADMLPRYHHLILGVQKHRDSWLRNLTVTVLRSGSGVGPQNIEYATINLPDFAAGTETACDDVYVFDAFNLPFQKIEIVHHPEIDLSSKMRVRFEEIKDFL